MYYIERQHLHYGKKDLLQSQAAKFSPGCINETSDNLRINSSQERELYFPDWKISIANLKAMEYPADRISYVTDWEYSQ